MATGYTEGTKVRVKNDPSVYYSYRGKTGVVTAPHPIVSDAVMVNIDGSKVGFEVRNLELVPKTSAERLAELQAEVTALQEQIEEERNRPVASDFGPGSVVEMLIGTSRGTGSKSLMVKTGLTQWHMTTSSVSDSNVVYIPRSYSDDKVQQWFDEHKKREVKVLNKA